jgi:hypothetical protein
MDSYERHLLEVLEIHARAAVKSAREPGEAGSIRHALDIGRIAEAIDLLDRIRAARRAERRTP